MKTSLNPIDSDPLGKERARHLLNRTLYGAGKLEYDKFAALSIQEALDLLMEDSTAPDPPLQVWGEDPEVAFGETWVETQ